ncbi:MAG TPA: DNA polymerase III subunit beta [Chloroflexota bacterium]|nr:DNA polymerase III subunit beta [Chloroflexota bacterium]
MKLSCLKSNLMEGLNVVGRVVPSKSTLPVLGNVLLATDRGQLKLAATNLDMAISYWVGAHVDEDGAVTLPARLLADFVSSLPDDRIDMALTTRGYTMHLTCGRFSANIKGIDAEDFPRIPGVADAVPYALPAAILRECIQSVVFAAAPDDSRPVLSGVLFTLKDGQLTLAAADGFRLAVRSAELTDTPVEGGQPSVPLQMIVPAKALTEVARVLTDGDAQVEIAATPNKNQVLFRLATAETKAEIVSRLIEGQFPDYHKILPKQYSTRAVVNTSEFLRATRAASVFARDNSMIVKLDVTPGPEELVPGRLNVTANSAEVGDNAGEVDASVDGGEAQIAFNGRYLRDALEALGTAQAALEVTGPSSPGVIKPVGEQNGYLHVIMPMQVSGGR